VIDAVSEGSKRSGEPSSRWTIARSPLGLDPTRYLGELRELPSPAGLVPGEWCEVVISDGEGAMRWTLVVEAETHRRPLDDALDLRPFGGERVAEREGRD
jgi:hypothetical protein